MTDVEKNQSCFPPRKDGKPSAMQELADFIGGGDFVRIAAAFVIAIALEGLIKQFVSSWVSPILGIFGGVDFADLSFTIRGSKFAYGLFFDALISFSKLSVVARIRP